MLDPCRRLEAEGFSVTYLPPDAHGVTSAEAVAAALTPKTVLVSVMAANNEIGTLNPVGEIARVCKERGIVFHTDAAQALGKVPLDVHALGLDLVSLLGPQAVRAEGRGRSLRARGESARAARPDRLRRRPRARPPARDARRPGHRGLRRGGRDRARRRARPNRAASRASGTGSGSGCVGASDGALAKRPPDRSAFRET